MTETSAMRDLATSGSATITTDVPEAAVIRRACDADRPELGRVEYLVALRPEPEHAAAPSGLSPDHPVRTPIRPSPEEHQMNAVTLAPNRVVREMADTPGARSVPGPMICRDRAEHRPGGERGSPRNPGPSTAATIKPAHPRGGSCAGLCSDGGLADAYRQHATALLGRATRLLADRGLAEDAVQETYLRAWRACGSFNPAGSPLRAWLSVILRNVVIDQARVRARRPLVLAASPGSERPSPGLDVDRVLALRGQLACALSMISAEHRQVLLHAIIHDRPYQEVATDLGVPTGTVKSRVHYALRHLRRLVDYQELSA